MNKLSFLERSYQVKEMLLRQNKFKLEQFDSMNPHLLGKKCHAGLQDGECNWVECPQNRDNEPCETGRHCPLDRYDDL